MWTDTAMTRPFERVYADAETNGLLDTVTRLHVLVVKCMDTGQRIIANQENGLIPNAIKVLNEAELVIGHHWLGYDHRALSKLYPTLYKADIKRIRDTQVLAMLMLPDIMRLDYTTWRSKVPTLIAKKCVGAYSLKAFGIRFGHHKGDYGQDSDDGVDVWAEWNQEMEDYCVLDVDVTETLWKELRVDTWKPTPIELIHDIQAVCNDMTADGYNFDVKAATSLYASMKKQLDDVRKPLVKRFGLVVVQGKEKEWKANHGHMYRGAKYCEVKFVPFNPTSRTHIIQAVQREYPHVRFTKYTEDSEKKAYGKKKGGDPNWAQYLNLACDEDVLLGLKDKVPEVPKLLEAFVLGKTISALATGHQAWLKKVDSNGKIHPRYKLAAVTGRATHSSPNIAQVPGVAKAKGADGTEQVVHGVDGGFGWECRSLFCAPQGWVQVGADMEGLELRCLGHYLDRFGGDGGRYSAMVTDPGIDIHTENAKAWSDNKVTIGRGPGKTLTYANLYGAGDAHIGELLNPLWDKDTQRREGRKRRALFAKQTKGLDKLLGTIEKAVEAKGWMQGLDGRRLFVRSSHAALNTLLQSAGAILCCQWGVNWVRRLESMGYKKGYNGDFVPVVFCHDEWQVHCKPELADVIGGIMVEEAVKAGEQFGFRCPLSAKYIVGPNWATCH